MAIVAIRRQFLAGSPPVPPNIGTCRRYQNPDSINSTAKCITFQLQLSDRETAGATWKSALSWSGPACLCSSPSPGLLAQSRNYVLTFETRFLHITGVVCTQRSLVRPSPSLSCNRASSSREFLLIYPLFLHRGQLIFRLLPNFYTFKHSRQPICLTVQCVDEYILSICKSTA